VNNPESLETWCSWLRVLATRGNICTTQNWTKRKYSLHCTVLKRTVLHRTMPSQQSWADVPLVAYSTILSLYTTDMHKSCIQPALSPHGIL